MPCPYPKNIVGTRHCRLRIAYLGLTGSQARAWEPMSRGSASSLSIRKMEAEPLDLRYQALGLVTSNCRDTALPSPHFGFISVPIVFSPIWCIDRQFGGIHHHRWFLNPKVLRQVDRPKDDFR